MQRRIDIRPLKRFALKLPSSALKDVLLVEDDQLDVSVFLARLTIWLRLLSLLEERG